MNTIYHYNDTPRATESTTANEGEYVHGNPQKKLIVELNTISSESRVSTHKKSYIYIKNLTYFSKIKKTSKIWNHDEEIIEIDTLKKFWLYNHYWSYEHFTCYELDWRLIIDHNQRKKINHLYSYIIFSQKMIKHL